MTEQIDPRQRRMAQDDGEISLFKLGAALLRNRWRIVRWMVIGGVIAVIPVFSQPITYTATASFVPEGLQDAGQSSGLRGIAGQFGVALDAGKQVQQPQFYVDLLKSRAILEPIARDTFPAPTLSSVREPLLDLVGISASTPARRTELGVLALGSMVSSTIAPKTGVVTLSVTTPWPSVSLGIAQRLVAGVNLFNLRARQSQALSERVFTEARLGEAKQALRSAEDRLQKFLQSNRQFQSSPELSFDRDRLQRDVTLQQQIVSSLAGSYEDVRIREVRDTPVITVIEQPWVPTTPNARGRARRVLFGVLLGVFVGAFIVLARDIVEQRRAEGDQHAEQFFSALQQAKADVTRPFRRRRTPARP